MNAKEQAQYRWDHVAKPLNSLGKLEKLVVQIAGVQNSADVRIDKRCVLVFCADHGVVAEGVSQSGQEVTALVARSIAEGTANINLMAGAAHADVFAVDMGMANVVPRRHRPPHRCRYAEHGPRPRHDPRPGGAGHPGGY